MPVVYRVRAFLKTQPDERKLPVHSVWKKKWQKSVRSKLLAQRQASIVNAIHEDGLYHDRKFYWSFTFEPQQRASHDKTTSWYFALIET